MSVIGKKPDPPGFRSCTIEEARGQPEIGRSVPEYRQATVQEAERHAPFPPVYRAVPVQKAGILPGRPAFTPFTRRTRPRYEPGFVGLGPNVSQESDGQPEWMDQFTDKKVRRAFIRKVYSIVALQLLFTFGIICLSIFEPHVRKFVLLHRELLWIAMILYVVAALVMICVEKVRREYPLNFLMLILITLCLSYVMAFLSCHYDTRAVLIAFGICAVACLAVTVLSFNTKLDFTSCGGILCISLVVLIIFGFLAIFFHSYIMTMIYAGGGALLFMAYLAYDTQLIMGGKRFQINAEEYVLAAIMLYIDVIYIFIYILMLVGAATGISGTN